MAVTPQTNCTLEEIAHKIISCEGRVYICGHISPDGDAIGSVLGLYNALRQLGRDVTPLLADDTAVLEDKFMCLDGSASLVRAKDAQSACSLFIAVDTPNPERLGRSAALLHSKADYTITVDHHAVDERMSDLSYTDPDAASTTMLVWRLAGCLGIDRDKSIATCCLTGLMTDCGSFQYQNADAEAFQEAAEMVSAGAQPHLISTQFFQRRSLASIKLEAKAIEHLRLISDGRIAISWVSRGDIEDVHGTKADCEPLINVLRSIDGVTVACMLREQPDGVRGSLRAKDGTDVSAVAKEYGGGGHKAAAGLTMHCSLELAVDKIAERLERLISEGCGQ